MERLVLFSMVILLLFGCHKGTGNFIIKGEVLDETFNIGLQDAVISIYKVPIGTSDQQFIESIVLPSSGQYQFTVPREKMERYVLKIEKEKYFPLEKDLYYSQLSLAQDNICDLSTRAKAWAKIHFKNINPVASDHFRYIKQEGLAACDECCPITTQNFYGPLDTTFYCLNNGNSIYSLFYWEMNTNNNGLKSANTSAFDTTLIEVIY